MNTQSGAYHLTIAVSDGIVSKSFYDSLFEQLQWETVDAGPDYAGYTDGRFTLWVMPAEEEPARRHHFKAVGFHHFALRVAHRSEVDEIFAWCNARNVPVVDAPQEYPEYNDGYYAVFFLDPDGMKLEVVYVP